MIFCVVSVTGAFKFAKELRARATTAAVGEAFHSPILPMAPPAYQPIPSMPPPVHHPPQMISPPTHHQVQQGSPPQGNVPQAQTVNQSVTQTPIVNQPYGEQTKMAQAGPSYVPRAPMSQTSIPAPVNEHVVPQSPMPQTPGGANN